MSQLSCVSPILQIPDPLSQGGKGKESCHQQQKTPKPRDTCLVKVLQKIEFNPSLICTKFTLCYPLMSSLKSRFSQTGKIIQRVIFQNSSLVEATSV